MSLPGDGGMSAVQVAFVRAAADDYEEHAAGRPDLAFQIDYYVPARTKATPPTSTRVLVVTGAMHRISALDALLRALTRSDDEEVTTCHESPF